MGLKFLDLLRSRSREAQEKTARSYSELLNDAATGAEVDADEAEIVISGAGKTLTQFEQDLRIVTEQHELRKQIAEWESEITKRRPANLSAIQKLREDIARLTKELSARERENVMELSDLQTMSSMANKARTRLLKLDSMLATGKYPEPKGDEADGLY